MFKTIETNCKLYTAKYNKKTQWNDQTSFSSALNQAVGGDNCEDRSYNFTMLPF